MTFEVNLEDEKNWSTLFCKLLGSLVAPVACNRRKGYDWRNGRTTFPVSLENQSDLVPQEVTCFVLIIAISCKLL